MTKTETQVRWTYMSRCSKGTPTLCDTGWFPIGTEIRWTAPDRFYVWHDHTEYGYNDVRSSVEKQTR